jgi:hAT family C-terminal dimerisation region
MEEQILLFKGLSVLDPIQLKGLTNNEVFENLLQLVHVVPEKAPRYFKGLKGFTRDHRVKLVESLHEYRTLAAEVQDDLVLSKFKERPGKLWSWWVSKKEDLPEWFQLAEQALLISPSSSSLERFFSAKKGGTSKHQKDQKPDTIELHSMCLHNADKLGVIGEDLDEK